jgi:hypothetical protein
VLSISRIAQFRQFLNTPVLCSRFVNDDPAGKLDALLGAALDAQSEREAKGSLLRCISEFICCVYDVHPIIISELLKCFSFRKLLSDDPFLEFYEPLLSLKSTIPLVLTKLSEFVTSEEISESTASATINLLEQFDDIIAALILNDCALLSAWITSRPLRCKHLFCSFAQLIFCCLEHLNREPLTPLAHLIAKLAPPRDPSIVYEDTFTWLLDQAQFSVPEQSGFNSTFFLQILFLTPPASDVASYLADFPAFLV